MFQILLDGEGGQWMPRQLCRTTGSDGTLLIRIPALENVPYARLQTLKTITCVPVLMLKTSIRVIDASGETVTLSPAYGETVESKTGVQRVLVDTVERAYPDAAVTLFVNEKPSKE